MIFKNNPGLFIINDDTGIWEAPLDSEFMDLSKELPWLNLCTFSIERTWKGLGMYAWSYNHYYIVFIVSIIYILLIYFGPKVMRYRNALKLEGPLKYWNLSLAIFSIIGSIRMLIYLITINFRYGFIASICTPAYIPLTKGPAGLWLILFIYSKYAELIDTLFIILRKRPLTFLHWFHHLTVLLYTWDAYTSTQTIGVYFCTINYIVHSIMYYYYYLTSSNKKPSWGVLITILQISQMIIGTFLTICGLYYSYHYPFSNIFPAAYLNQPLKVGCHFNKSNGILACLMYISYFALFFDFFIKKYITKGTPLVEWVTANKKKSD
ncbi:putative beta-ketoacyl-CoA synthase [Cryptosporidium serpentis]